jgi:hypothetical protein
MAVRLGDIPSNKADGITLYTLITKAIHVLAVWFSPSVKRHAKQPIKTRWCEARPALVDVRLSVSRSRERVWLLGHDMAELYK